MIERLDYRGELTDRRRLADRLAEAGLSATGARDKAELFAKVAGSRQQVAGSRQQAAGSRQQAANPQSTIHNPQLFLRALFVPGRIEVLGKHTDYAGGQSMVVAAEKGFCLVVSPRRDRRITVTDASCDETVEFELDPELAPRAGHWSNYPMTVARRISRNFPGASCGADIALASDLPPAAGMSSSSAMMVAVFLALAEVNRLAARPEYTANVHNPTDLAGYLGTVENGQTFGSLEGDRGVGTFGGSEDHTAILCARPDHLSQYAYCPVRFQRTIPIPAGYTFAVGSSGVVAEKTGAAMEKYNAASGRASAIVDLWRRRTGRDDPHLAAALASAPDAAERLREIVSSTGSGQFEPAALVSRLEHFITENQQILPAAGDALAAEDLDTFGRLVDRSQRGSEELLGNQVPQTVFLATSAREHGAVAASTFGAGFGGSVWALVDCCETSSFLRAWSESYGQRFPQHASASIFFVTGAGPAALWVC